MGILSYRSLSSRAVYVTSEAAILNMIRLEAQARGIYLWRNNVGALRTDRGDFVRYGLANESSAINRVIKSSDLVGVRPVIITQEHIGRVIGQFISREAKHAEWKYTATEREQAQLRWIELINSLGGDACFTTGEGSFT